MSPLQIGLSISGAVLLVTVGYLQRGDIRRGLGGIRLIAEIARGYPSFATWIAAARVKQVVRSMVAGSSFVIGAVLAVVPAFVQIAYMVGMDLSNAIGLGVLLVPVVAGLAGLWSLRRLPPRDYARIVVGGQPASDIMTAIAYEMLRLSRQFSNDRSKMKLSSAGEKILAHNTPDGLRGTFTPRQLQSLKTHTSLLAELMLGQQHQIQRVLEMKTVAERALTIRARRMCDHIFCFSPIVFDNRARKFVDNWEDVLALGNSGLGPQLFRTRVCALLHENQRIADQVKKRVEHLKRLIKYRDLHVFVHACASEHSATSCLKNYAEGLSHIARLACEKSERSRRGFRPDTKRYRAVCQRLRFLLRVQRAHPGFDLHTTCRRASRVALAVARDRLEKSKISEGVPSARIELEEKAVKALERKAEFLRRLEAYRYVHEVHASRPDDQRKGEGPDDLFAMDDTEARLELRSLSRLFDDITALVEESRDQIVRNFQREFRARYVIGDARRVVVVTHGYSKTVREVLQHVFAREGEERAARMFMLSDGSSDAFDARLMEYELRHDDRTKQPLTSGTQRNLRALVHSEKTFLVLLLGAESFDLRCRLVQSRGSVIELVQEFEEDGIDLWVVAVAESFKMRPSLAVDRVFYHDHLDRASLYRPGLVETIVTDRSIAHVVAADWRDRERMSDGEHEAVGPGDAEDVASTLEKSGGDAINDGLIGMRASAPQVEMDFYRRRPDTD